MTYFISGHRDLPYEDFEKYYIPVIDHVVSEEESDPIFMMGDCEGVDKFAMDYIAKTFPWIQLYVYHMFDNPRNTPLNLSVEELLDTPAYGYKSTPDVTFFGGFKSDEERDATMTKDSDFDIAFIKDNRFNSGTAMNIKRRHNIKIGMELKTIDAKTALSNVNEYRENERIQEEQKRIERIQKVFDYIKEASSLGQTTVGIKLSMLRDEDWEYVYKLLDKLGYKYSIGGKDGIVAPYINICWQ